MTIRIVKTGNKLRLWRMRHGISQADFARRLNTTSQVVCDWEKGRKTPDIESMAKIVDVTGGAIQPGDFFGIVGMHDTDEPTLLESAEE